MRDFSRGARDSPAAAYAHRFNTRRLASRLTQTLRARGLLPRWNELSRRLATPAAESPARGVQDGEKPMRFAKILEWFTALVTPCESGNGPGVSQEDHVRDPQARPEENNEEEV